MSQILKYSDNYQKQSFKFKASRNPCKKYLENILNSAKLNKFHNKSKHISNEVKMKIS